MRVEWCMMALEHTMWELLKPVFCFINNTSGYWLKKMFISIVFLVIFFFLRTDIYNNVFVNDFITFVDFLYVF